MTGSVVSAIVHSVTTRTASAAAPTSRESVTDPLEARNAEGWSGGTKYPPGPKGLIYRCHHCHAEMYSRAGARKHEQSNKHVVLRVDWDDPLYWDWVVAQPGRGAT